MTFFLLIIYSLTLWQLSSYPKIERVSIGRGGGYMPHAFLVTRSPAFLSMTIFWYIVFISLEVAPRYLRQYEWMSIMPGVSMSAITYFQLMAIFLFRDCANEEVKQSVSQIEYPKVAYVEEDYPSCLIGADDESRLVTVLRDPQINAAAVDTPFPNTREIPATLASLARRIMSQIWIQPLHPTLGKRMSDFVQELQQSTQMQADKAIDAIKGSAVAKDEATRSKAAMIELQKTNEMLNNKLLSVRTRQRGASGADISKMTAQELDEERERIMDVIRKIDDRKRQIANEAGAPSVPPVQARTILRTRTATSDVPSAESAVPSVIPSSSEPTTMPLASEPKNPLPPASTPASYPRVQPPSPFKTPRFV